MKKDIISFSDPLDKSSARTYMYTHILDTLMNECSGNPDI